MSKKSKVISASMTQGHIDKLEAISVWFEKSKSECIRAAIDLMFQATVEEVMKEPEIQEVIQESEIKQVKDTHLLDVSSENK